MTGQLLQLRNRALRGVGVALLAALVALATMSTAGAADVVDDRRADRPLHAQASAAPSDDETVTATNVLVASTVPEVHGTLVQTIQTPAFSPSSPDPAGITYIPETDRLLVSDSEVDEMAIYQGANFFTVTRTGSGVGTGTSLAFSREPTGISYDPATRRLFVSDDDADRISIVAPGTDGVHGTADDVWTRFGTAAFGSTDAEGLAYDQASGHLFICDGTGTEIYELDPVNGVFGDAGDVVTHFDIGAAGAADCEGVALDSARGALLAIDPSTARIYEFTIAGALTRIIRLTAIPTPKTTFADLVLAPSSNPNDQPSKSNLWIVDRQVDNGTDPNENDGLLYEVSLPDDGPPPDTAVTGPSGTWVRSTATFSLSSTPAGASFECRINGGVWAACPTPYSASTIVPGRYVCEFRAVGAGGADASPEVRELRVVRPFVADWDGDGKANVALWRPANGGWYVQGAALQGLGVSGDVPLPADFDGDGDVERAVFRPSNGGWYVSGSGVVGHGISTDVPVPADYDGDGDAEIAVYRPSNGGWYVRGQGVIGYGLSTDIPVPADYDGDGDADIAVFRPSNGGWYVRGQGVIGYGLSTDIPVPADWDGDGKTDMAVYRPSNGTWYVRNHSITQFGTADAVPLVGDFDGDPATDRVVWHPDTGTWLVEGSAPVFFGLSTDIP